MCLRSSSIRSHRELAKIRPEKVVTAITPLAGETTNTFSLARLHLRRSPSPFSFPSSPISTTSKTLSNHTTTSAAKSIHKSWPSRRPSPASFSPALSSFTYTTSYPLQNTTDRLSLTPPPNQQKTPHRLR